MPKIWRVENDTGEGCYQGIDSDLLHENDCNGIKDYNDKEHPTPYRDKGIKREQYINEICGFKNLKQAKQWFTPSQYKWLARYDFTLKRISVQKIMAIGEYQVLAIR